MFSSDATQKKRNTEAIETGTSQLVSARVVQHVPARTQALDEVRDRVKAQWVAHRAAELAKKQGEAKLAEWKGQASPAGLPAAITVSRATLPQSPKVLVLPER